MQVFTVHGDGVICCAGSGIRIAAKLLTSCACVGLVMAVLRFVRTLIMTLAEDLISPARVALEECMSLLPPHD